MLFTKNKKEKIDTQNHPIVKISTRLFNVIPRLVGQRFYVFKKGKFLFTPLMVILLVVEFTDIVFAVDSVPAVFAVTQDLLIVFFSNIFAILGLRSLFFIFANAMNKFKYLNIGIAILLVFVGFKMLAKDFLERHGFTVAYSLYIIFIILLLSILTSLLIPGKTSET